MHASLHDSAGLKCDNCGKNSGTNGYLNLKFRRLQQSVRNVVDRDNPKETDMCSKSTSQSTTNQSSSSNEAQIRSVSRSRATTNSSGNTTASSTTTHSSNTTNTSLGSYNAPKSGSETPKVPKMPKPKYKGEPFSAWKEYMDDPNQLPDYELIAWKKEMLRRAANEATK
ncbi:hypothetical protein LTR64_008236 [Lithohypha guttulata]|uniref:uncharacterized protein n=1 Tax=Lithohypha guttulata TaxID=1690604 RepID=UPI002DE10470|nr:hypothetical protein LTR51_008388 [Lithohypha guttulata]